MLGILRYVWAYSSLGSVLMLPPESLSASFPFPMTIEVKRSIIKVVSYADGVYGSISMMGVND